MHGGNSSVAQNASNKESDLSKKSRAVRHIVFLLIGATASMSVVFLVHFRSHRLHADEPQTVFRLMGSRFDGLTQAIAGFDRSGVQLIGHDGERFLPVGNGDDLGLFVLVPTVARMFRLSVSTAYDLTIGSLILASGLIGYFGSKEWPPKALWFFLLALVLTSAAADVYIFESLPVIAGFPWIFTFAKERRRLALSAAALALVFTAGISNLFRSNAGLLYLGVVLVIVVSLYPRMRAAILIVALACIFAVPGLYLRHLVSVRNDFLASRAVNTEGTSAHLKWHAVYAGLGWVKNSEVPGYRDDIAAAKAKSLNPQAVFPSLQYERVLKEEVFRIARQKPWIIAVNVFAKALTIGLAIGLILFLARKSF